jgi:hypothetical protein
LSSQFCTALVLIPENKGGRHPKEERNPFSDNSQATAEQAISQQKTRSLNKSGFDLIHCPG